MCMTKKQKNFVAAIERNTVGLTAVSTGVCPGCEQCRDEYGIKVRCECQDVPENEGEPDPDCDECDGKGKRAPTMEEFDEQWSSGRTICEGFISSNGCDLCDSPFQQTYEPWHACQPVVGADGQLLGQEIIHGDRACVDCVLYLANGDLPE